MKGAVIFFGILGILGSLLISLLFVRIVYILLLKPPTNTSMVEQQTDKATQVKIEDNVIEIKKRQKEIADLYLNSPMQAKRKSEIFFDLMAPFGALDPIANGNNIDTKATINFHYGAYASRLYPDENYIQYMVTRPIEYGMKIFKPEAYFKENNKKLDALAQKVLQDENVDILGAWATDLYRFNDYFWDTGRFYFWTTTTDATPFYQYSKVTIGKDSLITKDFQSVLEKYNPTFDEMYANEIQTIYPCGGNLIFIISGTVNNAVGLLYNSTNTDDITCGLLTHRFNKIILSKKLSNKWLYWVAN